MHDSVSVRPDRPFFLYLALGATHAPHQAPPEHLGTSARPVRRGVGRGARARHARQQEMGLLPPDTELAPRNPGVEAWDDMPEVHQRLAARLQEAFAAFLEHTDEQLGRLVDDLERIGVLDNTVIVLLSDNGASQEGGPFGVLHEMKYFNFILETPDEAIERVDDIGGPHSHSNYPWGWAQAGNTPFKWYKQNTHEGGVHVPLIVHWPAGITDGGGAPRPVPPRQRHRPDDLRGRRRDAARGPAGHRPAADHRHLAALHVRRPRRGDPQGRPVLRDDGPPRPSRPTAGRRSPGTRAARRSTTTPGSCTTSPIDRSECHDLAAEEPERLAALVDLWWAEAEAHGVLPLDDRTIELFGTRFRDRSAHPASRHYTYLPPMTPMPAQAAAAISGRSWDMWATIDRPAGAGGVLYASGTENSGLSFFVDDDHLVFDYNVFGEHHLLRSDRPAPVGSSTLGVRFRREGHAARRSPSSSTARRPATCRSRSP